MSRDRKAPPLASPESHAHGVVQRACVLARNVPFERPFEEPLAVRDSRPVSPSARLLRAELSTERVSE
jgi:hypothetical protein